MSPLQAAVARGVWTLLFLAGPMALTASAEDPLDRKWKVVLFVVGMAALPSFVAWVAFWVVLGGQS